MKRTIRYQGVVITGHRILLVRHIEHASGRSYWIMPGGGIEPGETEEECVQRELWEETHLRVEVERLLLEEEDIPGGIYQRLKTYLCRVIEGEASPGYEPEEEASQLYAIDQVSWFDLQDSQNWDPLVLNDPITWGQLQRIQKALGYIAEADGSIQ